MAILILGLVVFFAAHTLATLPERRQAAMDRAGGEERYRGAFSLVSLVGLVLIVWGYASAPFVPVWTPPVWTRHLALLLMLPAMIFLVAAYAPTGRIKARLRHPMLVAVKIWALAHLLANGDLASIVLFAVFLAWAVYDRISVKRRERAGLIAPPVAGPARNDAIVLVVGLIVYVVFLLWLHELLIGVSPIG